MVYQYNYLGFILIFIFLFQFVKADIKLCDNYHDCPPCGFYERCCFRQNGCGGSRFNIQGYNIQSSKGVCACGVDDWTKHGTCN